MQLVKENRIITLEDILTKLLDKFQDLTLSQMHVYRILKDNNVSLKLTRIRHEPTKRFGKDIDIKKLLLEFYDKIKEYNINNIICIDESSISVLMKRNFCRNVVGKRCVIKTHSQEVFKKYTSIFAITTNGCIGWELYEKGGIDSERLQKFINKFITNKFKHKLVILDNASSHRNQIVKDTIKNSKNELLYSVPYQHYTNSVLKSKLRKLGGLKYNEIKNNISIALGSIPKQIYINIFNGSYKRYKIYVKKSSKKYK